jgi:ribosomal protein S18 acetylase RimI-like enzyme
LRVSQAIQHNIRRSHWNPVRVGRFTLKLNPGSDNPYLNYAVPDDDLEPSNAEIDELVEAFRERSRRPRLEYVPAAAPALEDLLLRQGFAVENRLPVLTCDPGSRRDVPAPDGFEVVAPETDEELAGVVAVTNEAYEGDVTPPTSDDVAWRRAFKNLGGIMVLARDATSREPSGSGICEVPVEHVSELATVGVRPKFRRRGLAAAVTSRLALEAFDAGVELLWLSPLHDEGERIYRSVGFEHATEILHIAKS